MKGKAFLLASVAALALVATAGGAEAAAKKHHAAAAAASPSSDQKWADQNTNQTANSGPSLEDRVKALEDQMQSDEDKTSAVHDRVSALEQNFNDTSWSFDNARPTVKSGDGRFTMAIRVRFQFDEVNFFQDSNVATVTAHRDVQFKDLSSGSLVRRAFFGVEGKAFNDFWYEFRLNAGGGGSSETDPTLSLARVAYVGIPGWELNVGVIEPAMMFEGTTSSGQLMFLERPEIDNMALDSFGGGDGRRGIELRYQKSDLFMPGDNLVLNGAFTGGKTASATGHGNGGDEQTQLVGHADYRFWSDGISNASFGGDYSHAFTGGNSGPKTVNALNLQDRPQFREDGNRLVSTGNINARTADMWSAHGGVNFENFFLGGEYAHFSVDRLKSGVQYADKPEFSGWYVEGSWVLTGEPKTYTVTATNNEVGGFGAPKVASPFSFDGDSWGAWELTARYSDTDLNWHESLVASNPLHRQIGINGGQEKDLLFGLNWYMNQNVKLQLNDSFVQVDKLKTVGGAVQAGQNLNILGVRLQFTN